MGGEGLPRKDGFILELTTEALSGRAYEDGTADLVDRQGNAITVPVAEFLTWANFLAALDFSRASATQRGSSFTRDRARLITRPGSRSKEWASASRRTASLRTFTFAATATATS